MLNRPQNKQAFLRHIEDILELGFENKTREMLRTPTSNRSKRFFTYTSYQRRFFAVDVPIGLNIYRTPMTANFMLYTPTPSPKTTVLRCYWQNISGTTDRKFPFEVESIERSDFETVMVIGGGGFCSGAVDWLKNQQGRRNLRRVLKLEEFEDYYYTNLDSKSF